MRFINVLLTYLLGRYWPIPLQNADFQSTFALSASAVTSSKEVQLALIGSPLCAFQCTSVRRLAVAKKPCDFSYSICARSALAVTTSEKSSINTTRKSTTRFPVSLRWIVFVDLKPPKGLWNAVSKI